MLTAARTWSPLAQENEPKGAVMRLVASGGRSVEDPNEEGAGFGSVVVGVRTVSEAGTVGEWQREQMELFCISKLINCMIDSDEEFVIMDFHFSVQASLHAFLPRPSLAFSFAPGLSGRATCPHRSAGRSLMDARHRIGAGRRDEGGV